MSQQQSNTLNADDLKVLNRAFPRADHEFINSYVYLTESAVCNRIEEVDPAWTFEMQRLSREGDQTVCCARMTIKGVSREGVGMYRSTNPANEPEKSAATDALKRCARLFSIGRYLLDAPKEGAGFDKWLADQQKGDAAKPTPQANEVRPPASAPKAPASPVASGKPPKNEPSPLSGAKDTLYATVAGISLHEKKDGKGNYYRLHATDKNGDLLIVAFDTTALTDLGFNVQALTDYALGTVDYGYEIRVPYVVDEKDGKTFFGLDVETVMLSQQYTKEPT